MKMMIGENIKRLRKVKNITQEQLAQALNVTCAAVSKWEREDTYPDITLLQPLAYYFDVTIDELMGYDSARVEQEIDDIIAKYHVLYRSDYEASQNFIKKAMEEYSNDFRIMHWYMWNIGGGSADNDPQVLLAHKEEFLDICRKIQEGCTDNDIRLDSYNMQAKLLWAESRIDEALDIYKQNFSNWYATSGQKSEQLFAKNTPEFLYWVRKNLYELSDFAADKAVKSIFFDNQLTYEEKVKKAEYYGDAATESFEKSGDSVFVVIEESIFSRLANDLTYRGGTAEDIIRIRKKQLKAMKKIDELSKEDLVLYECMIKPHDTDSLLQFMVNYLLSAKHGRSAELLENKDYVKMIKQYVN